MMNENKRLKYCNPVPFSDGRKHTNPDPFILRWCGKYYCYSSDEFGVNISESLDLVHWESKGYAIQEKEFHHYWAPSVFYKNGVFYMYYSNIPAEEPDCHQQQLKLAVSNSPEGPFVWKKTFFDQFSIDSHPVLWNGELYMLYSVNDWYGTEDRIAGTCILVDKMKSPEELEGNPATVVVPSLKQEIYAANRFGDGRDWYTIEGACHVVHGQKCWMLYSANAYENVDYFVGTAVADNKEHFSDMEFKKYPDDTTWMPLLKKNDEVEGTGHNTVTKAPNMVDDWIVYHGRNAKDKLVFGTEQRVMRIDPLYYNGSHMFCMGPSWEETDAPMQPDKEVRDEVIKDRLFLADHAQYGRMEFWISAEKNHTGVRYGIYLEYEDEDHFLEFRFYSGRKKCQLYRVRDGIRCLIQEVPITSGYDYTVPHCMRVEKIFQKYVIFMDEEELLTFTEPCTYQNSRTGVVSYFSTVHLHSFVYTQHVMLEKNDLQNLSHFYQVLSAEINREGILSGTEIVQKEPDSCYTEEFLFQSLSGESSLTLLRDQEIVKKVEERREQFSLWHRVTADQEIFVINGEQIILPGCRESHVRLVLSDVGIGHYSYTKN